MLYICRGVSCKVSSTDQNRLDEHILADNDCPSTSYTITKGDDDAVA
jgi:hypothetical protein